MKCGECGHDYKGLNQHSPCPLCSPAADEDHHEELVRWFERWETATQESRRESKGDLDYYHGKQWTPEEKAVLDQRNQPVIVKNRIFKKINFILGTEIANRMDPKAMPRTMHHIEDVNSITDALRYLADKEDFDSISSNAWRNELVAGIGGAIVEHEIRVKENVVAEDTNAQPVAPPEGADAAMEVEQVQVVEQEPEIDIKIRPIEWDRIWYDLHSRRPNAEDAAYLGLSRWWYVDEAKAFYRNVQNVVEGFEDVLDKSTGGTTGRGEAHEDKPIWVVDEGGAKRIRVTECYYRRADEEGNLVWHSAHYTHIGFVTEPMPTGLKDEHGMDVCPMAIVSPFVTDEGERYGLVRHMISAQDEINKRSSKMLHLLSVDRMIYEDGAVKDPDKAQTERAKPDGATKVAPNALNENRVVFQSGMELAQGHHTMLQEAKQEIDQIGPDIPQIGSIAGSSSGRAIQQRMQVGSLELSPLNDNHKRWKRQIYRLLWLSVRQYWTTEKWLRVTDDSDDRHGFRFVGLNRRMTKAERFEELVKKQVPAESALSAVGVDPQVIQQAAQMVQAQAQQAGQQMPPQALQGMVMQMVMQSPPMQEMFTVNDVAGLDVDIILEESPDVAVVQQEELQELRETLQTVITAGAADPPMIKTFIKLIISGSQLRSRKQLLQMLDQPPDPQQVQMQQMQQQIAMQQMQLQLQAAQAQVQVLQAQAGATQAGAQLDQAKAQQTVAETQGVLPTEAEKNRAQAAKAMADAGDKTGQTLATQQAGV